MTTYEVAEYSRSMLFIHGGREKMMAHLRDMGFDPEGVSIDGTQWNEDHKVYQIATFVPGDEGETRKVPRLLDCCDHHSLDWSFCKEFHMIEDAEEPFWVTELKETAS